MYQALQNASLNVWVSRPAGMFWLLLSCSLNAVLQLHLGYRCPVHLVRAIGKAQRSGPGQELSQRVVAAQPCCSEGLADRAGGKEALVSPYLRACTERLRTPV